MLALMKTAPRTGSLAFCEFPDPVPSEDDLVIQVHAAGICGTDLSLYQWFDDIAAIYNPPLPLIMGHEFSGIVVDGGSPLSKGRIGQKVCVNPVIYCGSCRYCREGRNSLCDRRPCLGLEMHGGFAEYASVRAENVLSFPEEVPFELAALGEPLSVALHAAEQVRLNRSDFALVVGVGAIGLLQIIALQAAGVENYLVTGLSTDVERLEIARKLGARTLVADQEDPQANVLAMTKGRGADVVFETSGHASGVVQAIEAAGKGGRVALVGFPHDAVPFDVKKVAVAEKEIIGVRAHNRKTWQYCVNLLPQVVSSLAQIVTHRFPLEQGEIAFDLGLKRMGGKIVLLPQVGAGHGSDGNK